MAKEVSFGVYIGKLTKAKHADVGLTGLSKQYLDDIAHWVVKRMATAIRLLLLNSNRSTVNTREISYAIRLVFPGMLAIQANRNSNERITQHNGHAAPKGNRAVKAGLIFSPARSLKALKRELPGYRFSINAAVGMAAVLEYIIGEIIQPAGNAARGLKAKRVKARHIMLAIRGDEELDKLFSTVVLAGGVVPHILSRLLPKKKSE